MRLRCSKPTSETTSATTNANASQVNCARPRDWGFWHYTKLVSTSPWRQRLDTRQLPLQFLTSARDWRKRGVYFRASSSFERLEQSARWCGSNDAFHVFTHDLECEQKKLSCALDAEAEFAPDLGVGESAETQNKNAP